MCRGDFVVQSYEEAVLLLESSFGWDFDSPLKDSIVVVRPDDEIDGWDFNSSFEDYIVVVKPDDEIEVFENVEELINTSNEMWLFVKDNLDQGLVEYEEGFILAYREGKLNDTK